MRGCFVTGTDTGVGKTLVAAAIAARLRAAGQCVAVHKPVITGLDEPPERVWGRDDELLARAAGVDPGGVAPRRFGPPVSPHLAAELAGEALDPEALIAAAQAAGESADFLVVEGVGGLLVPLTADFAIRDLARALGLPLVVAARPGLGTLSHTLLTVEAARAGGLDVRAVVLTPWPAEPSTMEESNRATIAAQTGLPVHVNPWAADVAALLDPGLEIPSLAADPGPRPSVRLDHVVIAVTDWERSNAFYRDVALADVVRVPDPPEPPRWRYRFGAQQLNVHGPGMDAQPVAGDPVRPGNSDLCLVWPGPIADAVAHLRRHGVPVEQGPVPRNGARGPGSSVYFRDPDGTLLEFLSYVRRPD